MIAHFADLQLGYNHGPNGKSDDRARDVWGCFDAMIWEIVERQPSTVLFVGDIFHYSSPRRADLFKFQWGLDTLSRRLRDTASIIAISGNHDTPKSSVDIHPLRLFEHIPKVTCVHEGPQLIQTDDGILWAIPWIWGEPLETSFPDVDAHFLAVHAPVLDLLPEAARESQVRYLDPRIGKDFEYVALGDFHDRRVIDRNVVMPGSIERTGFGEAGSLTGGAFVSWEQPGPPIIEWWESPARPMHLLDLDLTGKPDPDKILTQALESVGPDPLIRLTVAGVDPKLVELGTLARKFQNVKIKWVDAPKPPVLSNFIPGEVTQTWTQFAKKNNLPSDVCQLGSEALQAASPNQ